MVGIGVGWQSAAARRARVRTWSRLACVRVSRMSPPASVHPLLRELGQSVTDRKSRAEAGVPQAGVDNSGNHERKRECSKRESITAGMKGTRSGSPLLAEQSGNLRRENQGKSDGVKRERKRKRRNTRKGRVAVKQW